MNNSNNVYFNILKNKDTQKELKLILKPLFEVIIENISIYLYIFIFFILINFLLHLGILIILMRYVKINNK
jgi:hypothetical protein